MSAFSYSALDTSGKQLRGVLEADSMRQVRQLLRDKGLVPLTVEQGANEPQSQKSSATFFKRGIKTVELALLTRQLATLVQSAMPLEECLSVVAAQSERDRVRIILAGVRSKVLEGYALAAAMREYSYAFPDMYCAMVDAGEQSGHLDGVLERLADYTESQQDAKQQIKLAMLYPAILVLVSLLIVSGLLAFVVPQVVGVFVEQGQELPWLTANLLSLSGFVASYGWLLVLAFVGLIMAVKGLLRNDSLRLAVHRFLATAPVVKRFSRAANSAQFSSTLSILVRSGVPLVDAMRISQRVVNNFWLREELQDATQKVMEGSDLQSALASIEYFPPMLIHMIGSGEASGSLGEMLQKASQNEQRGLDQMVATGLKMFEPITLLTMGVVVFTIVLAILQPVFELNQLI